MPALLDLKRDAVNSDSTPTQLISWEAEEFSYSPKTKEWFIAAAIFSAGVLAVSIITKNLLLGIMAPLMFFLLSVYGAKKPRKLRYTITTEGIVIGNRLWKYNELKSFWIFTEPHIREITIENRAALLPKLNLPLGENDPLKIKEILVNFLPEVEQQETLSDIFTRKIKF